MDQFSSLHFIFDNNDSCENNYNSKEETKPTEVIFSMELRKRNTKISQIKSIQTQLLEDPLYSSCINHIPLFIKYLENKGYKCIYEYLQYCQRKGILLEYETQIDNKILIPTASYSHQQCLIIHQKNLDQQNVNISLNDIKQLKKQNKINKMQDKIVQQSNIEYFNLFSSLENDSCNVVIQRLQRSNKQQYTVTPINIKFNESLTNYCWQQFKKFIEKCEREFERELLDDEELLEDETSIIDYDLMSNDSLEPFYKIPPIKRPIKYRTIQTQISIQPIKIIHTTMFIQ